MDAPIIEIAAHAGVCYGVERALTMALDAAASAADGHAVSTLGPLIHNPLVVRELAERGVVAAPTAQETAPGTLVIRAHGVTPAAIEDARERGLAVLDATCPYVKKVHAAAERLVREGFQLLVIGESGHPEVEGILGHAAGAARVIASAADLDGIELARRVGVVVQTTQTAAVLSEVTAALAPRVGELRVVNTICAATQERQDSAAELAARADVMLVVGGRNSGNTRRLAEICRARCAATHHIEDAAEIEPSWFAGARLVGITAGASTPAAHIERARRAVAALAEA